jgi:SCF-associated factor 1
LKQILEEKNDPNKRADATADKVIPCEPITIDSFDLTRLPALPPLPPLSKTGGEDGIPQLIQIAGLEGYLIGLTNHGHVLKFGKLDGLDDDDPQPQLASRGRWDYVSLLGQCWSFMKT